MVQWHAHKDGHADRPPIWITTLVFVFAATVVVFAGTAIVVVVRGIWIDLFTR